MALGDKITLAICDSPGHQRIWFQGFECPLCEMHRKADALDEEITELKQEIHDLVLKGSESNLPRRLD